MLLSFILGIYTWWFINQILSTDDNQENDLKLKKKQNPLPKDVDETMNLKPFSKPSDEIGTPSEEASYSSPVIDQKDQRKKGDGIVDKPKLKSTSPTEIRKEDDQDDLKKIETRTGTFTFILQNLCRSRKKFHFDFIWNVQHLYFLQ